MRIRWKKEGGHIHCRVFTARAENQTFGHCGNLVFDEREWPEVRHELACSRAIQIIEEAS